MYAAGKIPGGFFKREGRATERATLTARMIDRPIRPLWPKGFRNEVQVICTVLSADLVTPHDILCINGASAALMISPLPFLGPIGAVRIGRIEDEFVVNPTLEQLDESTLDLIVVGTSEALTMVEAGGDQIPEDEILEALELAHCRDPQDLRGARGPALRRSASRSGSTSTSRPSSTRRTATPSAAAISEHGLREAGTVVEAARRGALAGRVDGLHRGRHDEAGADRRELRVDPREGAARRGRRAAARAVPRPTSASSRTPSRTRRSSAPRSATSSTTGSSRSSSCRSRSAPRPPRASRRSRTRMTKQFVKRASEAVYKDLVRKKIAVDKRRPDGRSAEEIRHVECEVTVSPRTHGSALFTRGQTQIMTLLTLGTMKEGQQIDDLSREQSRRVHAPLQLPALLGRGDGLHARPEAA